MEEEKDQTGNSRNVLGRYCKFSNKCGKTHCWCNSSDWEEGLLNVEKQNSNPSIAKTPSPTIRKPPVGWSALKHKVIMAARENR